MAVRSSSKPLARLLRDTGGNTLAIMAMAIFPLAGLVGGGVDMSRLYLSRARLQQACDAGALAGRKVMGSGTWAANGNAAQTTAQQFFAGNFQTGAYGTTNLTRAYTESEGKVSGTASVTVPMTIMRIFGSASQRLAVVCDAEMRLPNTDIMFVLDTTGSMNDVIPGDPTGTRKIVTLKKAVKCFYETVAKIDTAETCGTGPAPSGGLDTTTQVRFGFVPYATNVNVGRLLPSNWFADSWTYQSREAMTRPEPVNVDTPTTPQESGTPTRQVTSRGNSVATNTYYSVASDADCQAKATIKGWTNETSVGPVGQPYNQQATGSPATRTHQTSEPYTGRENGALYDATYKVCYVGYSPANYNLIRNYAATDSRVTTTRQVFDKWRYAPLLKDIRGLKNGTGWNAGLNAPVGDTADGAVTPTSQYIGWDGCIEERQTIKKTDYSAMSATERTRARDLDIDFVPVATDATSLWGPALRNFHFSRKNASGARSRDPIETATNYPNEADYKCPVEAKKLQVWPTATPFENYVNSLGTDGNTYHDIGMIWGSRLMSPTGIFADENAFTPRGGEIERHMIFMTDGDTCTGKMNYNAYGVAFYDRRQTDETAEPTDGCSNASSNGGTLSAQVDARFPALCTALKNKNITLWVVYFGTTDATTTARMTNCASSGRFQPAANSATLLAAFAAIADQISQLRLTQ